MIIFAINRQKMHKMQKTMYSHAKYAWECSLKGLIVFIK